MEDITNMSNPSDQDILNAFGIGAEADDNPSPEFDENSTPPEDIASEESGEEFTDEPAAEEEVDEDQQIPQQQPQNPNNAQNQAFARMRTQNAQMQKTMQRMAQVLGLDPSLPPEQLASVLQQQSTTALARRNNIDPAILNRLDELEARDARYRQMEYESNAKNAFMTIQERFGATPEDLQYFVQDLVQSGYDMAAPGANLVTEFINRNFDAIVQFKVDAAVRAEQERSTKASGASKPSTKQGQSKQTTNNDVEVNSVEDMEDYLNSLVN